MTKRSGGRGHLRPRLPGVGIGPRASASARCQCENSRVDESIPLDKLREVIAALMTDRNTVPETEVLETVRAVLATTPGSSSDPMSVRSALHEVHVAWPELHRSGQAEESGSSTSWYYYLD